MVEPRHVHRSVVALSKAQSPSFRTIPRRDFSHGHAKSKAAPSRASIFNSFVYVPKSVMNVSFGDEHQQWAAIVVESIHGQLGVYTKTF